MKREDFLFIKKRVNSYFNKTAISDSFVLFYAILVVLMVADLDSIFFFVQIYVAAILVLLSLNYQCYSLDRESNRILRRLKIKDLEEDLKTITWKLTHVGTLKLMMLILIPSALFCSLNLNTLTFFFISVIFCVLFAFVFSQYLNSVELNYFLENNELNNELNENIKISFEEDKLEWKNIIIGLIVVSIIFVFKYYQSIIAFIENMPQK